MATPTELMTGLRSRYSWRQSNSLLRKIEADEVGASLKFATAKVERATERATSDRTQGRERQAERGGDFNDQPPF